MQKIDNRLRTALKYLRCEKSLADIGTDHAYLPIYAVQNGYSAWAVASDINDGPAERARINVSMCGLSDRITVVKTDGLHGIERFDPDDIAIFGMGGELIANIIDGSSWSHKEGKRFILQPMTCADMLRYYLAEKGFKIVEETLSKDFGKLYVTICAEPCGKKYDISTAEAILGAYNIKNERKNPLFHELLTRAENAFLVRLKGKKSGGRDFSHEEKVLLELHAIKKEIENEGN
ncbi:MAG: class I SAM-dependent methyltransferase [Clostridia bacterium]|nr:class I SAM-dependent methyltransferase [Clostridia bacterium]